MRDFLDSILESINIESLTNEEFESIDVDSLTEEYTEAVYLALKTVLLARENISNQVKRLKLLFIAKGTEFTKVDNTKPPMSNILIGVDLC